MNRKNLILSAVAINAGLLTVMLIVALTTQKSLPSSSFAQKEEKLDFPNLDEPPLYRQLPKEVAKCPAEKREESIVHHQLPALVVKTAKSQVKKESDRKALSTSMRESISHPVAEVVVKKGDNLERLAKAHHTTIDEIIKLNHLPSSFLKIGQVLKIPVSQGGLAKSQKKKGQKAPEYYTIKVGENPWAIAIRYHMKLDKLLKLNGLNEEKARKLKPGDRLRIR